MCTSHGLPCTPMMAKLARAARQPMAGSSASGVPTALDADVGAAPSVWA